MSNKRQTANELIQATANSLVARKIHMRRDEHDPLHRHPWHQLIYPHRGILKTRAGPCFHCVPSNRAVLIPAGYDHESWAVTPVQFIGIYFSPSLLRGQPTGCRVLEISPFLRELILEVQATASREGEADARALRLYQVLCDQLLGRADASLELPIPGDKRVQPIVEELTGTPGGHKRLATWAGTVGASGRTISRIFERETGLTFGQWRRRARLINALPLLQQNMKVQAVAQAVGFESPSAFVYSFKREFGVTPGRYFSDEVS